MEFQIKEVPSCRISKKSWKVVCATQWNVNKIICEGLTTSKCCPFLLQQKWLPKQILPTK
jgi:hypothetical protein